jgi:Zn finger protein HypA/HybF involved in hydrogenase expression
MKYNWSDKNKFFQDWYNSNNICDFLKKNHLTPTSGNYAQFKKWYKIHTIGLLNISTEIFIENSIHSRLKINKLIKKHNLIPYQCKCGIKELWNGLPITLQLEHKNGINNDHRLENLEYLCPNCHAQTQSYGGTNVKLKMFEQRLSSLLIYKILTRKNIEYLSLEWKITYDTACNWIRKNLKQLEEYGIKIDYDVDNHEKLNLITSRTQDAIALTNKKELPILAKKWGISVNATKKWIRNNLPEHFDTIFDDALLVKNQKKQHKENYYQTIAQLNHDSFNLDEFMTEHQIKAKASAYSLIKAHNPGLYEKLMPDVVCIYCTGKTRTAGQSGGQTRYRCLDCDKSFVKLLTL